MARLPRPQLLEAIEAFQKRERRFGGLVGETETIREARPHRSNPDSNCCAGALPGAAVAVHAAGAGRGAAGGERISGHHEGARLSAHADNQLPSPAFYRLPFPIRSLGCYTSSPAIGPIFGVALFPLLAICSPLIFLLFSLARDPISQALPDAAISYLATAVRRFHARLASLSESFRTGRSMFLYLMLLVWCGDIAAYYVGRAIGRQSSLRELVRARHGRVQLHQSLQR